MAEIVLDGVTKRFSDGTLAVAGVDLAVADGELVVLVGPSGSGKSTLLDMVAGLEEITAGTLSIGGRVVNDRTPRERDIAMVFQSYALYPHMTVRRNLAFPLEIVGLDRDAIRVQVEETAALLELTAHLERKPAQLSGGQRQRVAMGRAMVRRPQAFLMDEPLSNLDARLRVEMRRQVARLQKRLATTTLYVTHDQTEAMTLGDRVVVMRRGVVQQIGSPQRLYAGPANLFVAGFIGSPAMNFVPGTLDGTVLRSPLGEASLPDRIRRALEGSGAGRDVILGLRPEHLAETPPAGDGSAGPVRVPVDAVETLGSDLFAYFTLRGEPPRAPELEELSGEGGGGAAIPLVARLGAGSPVAAGAVTELWYDSARLHVFDARSGASLTQP